MITTMTQAALPTARALAWRPLAVVAGLALLVALSTSGSPRPRDMLVSVVAVALASTAVAMLHDPAGLLLGALPVSLAQRRLLRITTVAAPLLLVWWLVGRLTESTVAAGPAPLMALVSLGVAVATWVRGPRAVLAGTCLPVAVLAAEQLLATSRVGEALGWWRTEPWWVSAAAVLACVVGSRR